MDILDFLTPTNAAPKIDTKDTYPPSINICQIILKYRIGIVYYISLK